MSALGLRVKNLQKDVPLCIAEIKNLGVRNCSELETLQKFRPKQLSCYPYLKDLSKTGSYYNQALVTLRAG